VIRALFGWEIQPVTTVFFSHAKSASQPASQPAVFSSHAKSVSHPASQPAEQDTDFLIFHGGTS